MALVSLRPTSSRPTRTLRRVLIANRGEIAVRVIRACFDEGLETVLAASAADRDSLAAQRADRVVVVGGPPATESYLSVERIVAAAQMTSCDALHPGYGFLSERPELPQACAEAGIAFVGPPADVMRRAGDKMAARSAARKAGIPTGGGSEAITTLEEAVAAAGSASYPVMLKAAAGGGGRGMAIVAGPEDLGARFASARAEAQQAFGDGRLYLERYLATARHVEVQILADTHGNVVHLGERDCSTQRRYQKLVEEAPAPGLPRSLVARICDAAVTLARRLDYVGAGTAEFLVDADRDVFVFLEVNARVQVEHPVTEMVTGIDIVREQLRIAAGKPLSFGQSDIALQGHAIECRINAEDPAGGFIPSPGLITRWTAPDGSDLRIETHCATGVTVPPYYDALLAKVIARGADRDAAVRLMLRALHAFKIEGVQTTVMLLRDIVADERFRTAAITTRWLEDDFMDRWEKVQASVGVRGVAAC